eukprot:TRINITY_DN70048_c0_g1_i1.p1 TRINITY_DN70048_c0_g1~~TRINITY_DN70048_c0_g1_i1.p1  ORF type:complete len:424 (-),score=63.03 TRINITY_DN70048_c0_g1_i1:56-1327(-)
MANKRSLGGSHGNSTLNPPPTPSVHRGEQGIQGPRAAVGASSHPNVGKGTDNQDTYVASASNSGSKCFVGVFDGHGEHGGRVSHFVRDCLSKSLFSREDIHSDPKGAIEHAYRETAQRLERQYGRDIARESGSTALSAYQHRDRLFVANVGDCRAVLGRCETARGTSLNAVDMSRDHKPGRADEKQRILALGGKVDQGCFPVAQGGGIRWMKAGPERVMDKHGVGGLALSRSLGDLALRPYVNAQPEVLEKRLDRHDKLLVLGSDGIWDQLSSKEAVDIAGRHVDPRVAAKEIAEIARRRWQEQTQGQVSDDITALVVRLDNKETSPPKTPTGHRVDRDVRSSSGASYTASTGSRFHNATEGGRSRGTSRVGGQRDGSTLDLTNTINGPLGGAMEGGRRHKGPSRSFSEVSVGRRSSSSGFAR